MNSKKLVIEAGSSKMKIKNGRYDGWHKFSQNAQYKVAYDPKMMGTVIIVSSGPDKGKYAFSL